MRDGPLTPSDIERLDARQAAPVKAALGLLRSAHHMALLLAVGVPRIGEALQGAVLRAFSGIFRSDHRLHHSSIAALAQLAMHPGSLKVHSWVLFLRSVGSISVPSCVPLRVTSIRTW